ncbi:MAG: type IV pilus twitching motility protein PilT [Elusimicrobia bacterium]|nr:type IV pilus twitching motility protein PilT [Elusimicrobiota bacterium]
MADLVSILKSAVNQRASDIHICVGKPPMMRLSGAIQPIDSNAPPMSAEETKKMIYSALYDDQRAKFEKDWELDCSFAIKGISRFRLNVLIARNGVEAVMRVIPSIIPTAEQLKLSSTITDLSNVPKGLILVTGPTGSGKTTTLACILDMVNQKRSGHILTIEDPIEFTYDGKACIVRQREIGQHTKTFGNALRAALREDPNVILVGEMRDLETIQLTITAAETGHLTFATLHTQDAPSTIDRIIDVFPPHQQMQVRVQLASSLKAVVSQILLPRKDGKGRVAAREIMIMTPAISNLIREGKTHMIYSAIETGMKFGMIPMDKSLANLVKQDIIERDIAVSKAHNIEVFKKLCGML